MRACHTIWTQKALVRRGNYIAPTGAVLYADELLFLIINQRQFSILPLADFDSPEQADLCTDLASRHLPRLRERWV